MNTLNEEAVRAARAVVNYLAGRFIDPEYALQEVLPIADILSKHLSASVPERSLLAAGRRWIAERNRYQTDPTVTNRAYGEAADALALAIEQADKKPHAPAQSPRVCVRCGCEDDPSDAARAIGLSRMYRKEHSCNCEFPASVTEGGVVESVLAKLGNLLNASYTELRLAVETNKEYALEPDHVCLDSCRLDMKHYKFYANTEEWAVAERVSGWFQGQIAEVITQLESLTPATGEEK